MESLAPFVDEFEVIRNCPPAGLRTVQQLVDVSHIDFSETIWSDCIDTGELGVSELSWHACKHVWIDHNLDVRVSFGVLFRKERRSCHATHWFPEAAAVAEHIDLLHVFLIVRVQSALKNQRQA